jgi:hypothetical protein
MMSDEIVRPASYCIPIVTKRELSSEEWIAGDLEDQP